MTRQKTSFQIANQLDQLKKLQHHLETFAGPLRLSDRSIFELNFILEELVSNIILHGYTDTALHFIDIEMTYENQIVTIEATDDGKPFNPIEAKDPDVHSPLHEREIGGLGIYMLKKLTRKLTYERQEGKNHLVLKKKITLREK